jgi:hypothetical protein
MMSWKTWLDWIIKLILVVGLVFCLFGIRKQNVIISELQTENVANTQALSDFAELGDLIADYKDVEGNQIDRNELVVQVLKELDGIDDKEEFTALEQRIEAINEAINKLNDKEEVTIGDLEALVNNALVDISKPAEALVVKPMPNTTPIAHKVTLSDREKADLIQKTRDDLYKAFEKVGYGEFVDGEFALREAFYGAEIRAGDEWKYEPVESLD